VVSPIGEENPVSRRRTAVIIGAVVVMVAAAGAGVGVGVTAGSGSSSARVTGSEGAGGSMSSYYDSMMRNYPGGSMMSGPAGSIS
jgi:hypothetical protein